MMKTIVAFGSFDTCAEVVVRSAKEAGGEVRFATDVAGIDLAHMPKRPDAVVLRLEAEHLDEFTAALHTHPKLEGVPLIAILERLTATAAIRASTLGADDFLSLADMEDFLGEKLAAATREPAQRPRPRQCKVLLADPSPMHGRVLSRLLVQAGFDVTAVATLEDLRRELGEPRGYGLAVIDLGLPGSDPAALLATVRERLGDAAPPAIAMTHPAVPPERASGALQAGFRHMHDKRRPPDELVFLAHEASVTDHAKLRAAPRLLCAVLVGFRREGRRWEYGLSHNISLSGLFVRTIDPPPAETILELEFTPPASETAVKARAQVAWRKDFSAREVRASPTGMGLKLLEPDEGVQRAMAAAVAALARKGPGGA